MTCARVISLFCKLTEHVEHYTFNTFLITYLCNDSVLFFFIWSPYLGRLMASIHSTVTVVLRNASKPTNWNWKLPSLTGRWIFVPHSVSKRTDYNIYCSPKDLLHGCRRIRYPNPRTLIRYRRRIDTANRPNLSACSLGSRRQSCTVLRTSSSFWSKIKSVNSLQHYVIVPNCNVLIHVKGGHESFQADYLFQTWSLIITSRLGNWFIFKTGLKPL